MDEEGPFDGVLGYSLGASTAASLVIDEQRRYSKESRVPMLRAAIFFMGFPPMDADTDALGNQETDCMLLADTSSEVIQIPTFHVVGSLDPMAPAGKALFNMCDVEKEHVFDHGQMHTIPRDSTRPHTRP